MEMMPPLTSGHSLGPEARMLWHDFPGNVTAFSTTRHGGLGKGAYSGLNINGHCGDDPAAVMGNLGILCRELGLGPDGIIMPRQAHSDRILRVDRELAAGATVARCASLEGVDGLINDVKGISIGVSTADCIPVLLYDMGHHASGAVHAGWRGTRSRIVQKAVRAMGEAYGTDPAELFAHIGPGISLDAFEVGDEVYGEFSLAGFDMGAISERREKWHIDLKGCNCGQLVEMGVPEGNVSDCGVCSYGRCLDFFSARRLGTRSGRTYTGIILR